MGYEVIPVFKSHCFWGILMTITNPLVRRPVNSTVFVILCKYGLNRCGQFPCPTCLIVTLLQKIGHLYLCVLQPTGWTSVQVKTYSRPVQDKLSPPSARGLFVLSEVWQHRGRRCPGEIKNPVRTGHSTQMQPWYHDLRVLIINRSFS